MLFLIKAKAFYVANLEVFKSQIYAIKGAFFLINNAIDFFKYDFFFIYTSDTDHFAPHGDNIFPTLKAAKLQYFNTIFLENLSISDLHHPENFQNVRTLEKYFFFFTK